MPKTYTPIQIGIINGYRELVRERYDFNLLQQRYDIPAGMTAESIEQFKQFFLSNIYPDPDRRKELDTAFEVLDVYIQKPEKLLRILMDSRKLFFKYGRHLPKMLMAGLKALQSFRAASDFEVYLIEQAKKSSLQLPYEYNDMIELLRALDRDDIKHFMSKNVALFDILKQKKLVKNIVTIVLDLIDKMKQKPEIYRQEEVNALEVGRCIIAATYELIKDMTTEEQEVLIQAILQVEQDFYDELLVG